MKTDILNLEGEKVKQVDLPKHFNEEIRPDLIKRAVLVIQSHRRQTYGSFKDAGKRPSAKLSRRRRAYRGAYGRGISRIPRKSLWSRGRQFGWVGAFAPGTVGGRRAHPPKAEKIWDLKINKNERIKAIRSAIAATAYPEIVKKRGHKFELKILPVILDSSFCDLKKTKDVKNVLKKIKLDKEIERCSKRKIRAGKGKKEGRKYKTKKGPLIIIEKNCPLVNACKNIAGIEIIKVNLLNAELLAPGAIPGRLVIWTEKALEKLDKDKLFFKKTKGDKTSGEKSKRVVKKVKK